MASLADLAELFQKKKAFDGWVGSVPLNRLGLHPARMALTDACVALRRLQVPPADERHAEIFARDGVLVVEDILPEAVFDSVRDEVRGRLEELSRAHPPPATTDERGFGRPRPFAGGFDRFDGGSRNRMIAIDEEATPATFAAVRSEPVRRLCSFATGFPHRPGRFSIYELVHGDDPDNHDLQKDLHRDTFHSAVKVWLFLKEVTLAHGPFMYVPGSHRMTPARYRWEYRRAVSAARDPSTSDDGSFRIDEAELPSLGLPPPGAYPVPANTLVLADVRGFHRRGHATLPAARRLSLWATLREAPFSPIAKTLRDLRRRSA